jgi:hypothetical protein
MQIHLPMRLLVGTILICSATALAQPKDAPPPAPVGPSGDARPVDPYANPSTPPPPQTNTPAPSQPPPPSTSAPASPESPAPSQQPSSQPPQSPAAPAPSQQQPAPQAPQPNTTPVDAKPQPPASEQKPLPPIDKPGPAPVDQPAPSGDKPAQSKLSNQPVTSLSPRDPSLSPPSDTSLSPPSATPPRSDTSLSPPSATPPRSDTSPPGATPPIAGEPAPTATPSPHAALVDVANAPASCREAGNRVSSRDHNTALSAKVSFALCTASSAISGLSLVDAEASVNDVDRATANAFALLDEVAASGDPRWQIVALHAQGDLLGQMTRRMLDTVPPAGAGATQSAVALHDTRVQLLQSRVQPWIDRAQHAFSQVDQLARANPQLASNQMVGNAVADSRHKLTTGVATR